MSTINVTRQPKNIKIAHPDREIVVKRRALTVNLHDGGRRGLPGPEGEQGPQGTPGVVQTIVGGTNVTVDSTDPANPIVNTVQTYDEYIYNSSGAEADNRYNDWSDLMAAISGGQDGPIRITFEEEETLPTGTFNLDNVMFAGTGKLAAFGGYFVTLPDGFNVSSWVNGGITSGLSVIYEGTNPLITYTTGINLFMFGVGSAIATTANVAFDVTGDASFLLTTETGATLPNLSYELMNLDTTGAIIITVKDAVSVEDDVFRGDATTASLALILVNSPAAQIDPDRTDANLTGTMTVSIGSRANLVGFNNTGTGMTSDNVQDAILEAYENTGTGAVDSVFGRTGAVVSANGDYTASQVTNVPSGNISSTQVQAALNELDTEKVSKSGDSMTGNLTTTGAIIVSRTDNQIDVNRPLDTNRAIINFYTNNASGWRLGKYSNSGGNENFILHKSGGGDPLIVDHTTETVYIDKLIASTSIDVNSNPITSVEDPTNAQDAATKNYVDTEIAGIATGITRAIVNTLGNFTAGSTASTDYVYIITGNHTPTMPTAVGNTNRYTFKNNHSANISFSFTGGQTADGGSLTIAPGEAVDLISNNTNWSII